MNNVMPIMIFFLLASNISLAQELKADKLIEQRRIAAQDRAEKIMQETIRVASDRSNPAQLDPSSDLSFDELERRWQKMLLQANTRKFTTQVDSNTLLKVAQHAACDDVIGVMPTGVAYDPQNRQMLNGASLFARCKADDYIVVSSYSIEDRSAKRMLLSPKAYNSKIGAKLARKLYFKSSQGTEYSTLTILGSVSMISIEHWSHDESKARRIVNNFNGENALLDIN